VSSVRRLLPLAVVLAFATAAPAALGAPPLNATVAAQLARAGSYSGGYVLDTTTGRVLASVRADTPRIPASVEKLYTTSTALLRFGAGGTLATTVRGSGTLDDFGTWHGDLYLCGGGDPTFGTAAFAERAYGAGATVGDLATALRDAGVRRVTGTIYGDESWLDRLRGGPTTGYGLDVTELGGPLGGLLFDRGLARTDGSALQTRPAKFAAQQLAAELRVHGVRVSTRRIGERAAPATALELVRVDSPPISALVRLTLAPSDNLFAEMLLKDVGAAFGSGGSTAAGAAVVRRTVARYGIRPAIYDGSGLSRADRTSPRQVVTLLARMRSVPALRAGLAVAGRTGTLTERMRHSSAQGRCQAKTGTLSDVSALAGYCRTPNGHVLAFAFMENLTYTVTAKKAEDALVIQLARSRPTGQPLPPSSPASNASSPASSSTGTPRRSAFSSFEPAASPATR
jgi:D-alanyl-D-alanine carboxypeptidase/D-alanyl-D-alanine-endopeptidase (penicillin-binding protein 4)